MGGLLTGGVFDGFHGLQTRTSNENVLLLLPNNGQKGIRNSTWGDYVASVQFQFIFCCVDNSDKTPSILTFTLQHFNKNN